MSAQKISKNTRLAVAMSGGVDSAVAAALLKARGFSVVGFFMKNWGETTGLKKDDCPWVADRQDAMLAAAKLDIPFHTLDFEVEYKKSVLDYFFREYAANRTPNPDVLCNSRIKFGVLLDKVRELGFDYLATGHYARISLRHSELAEESRVKRDEFRDPSTSRVRPVALGDQAQDDGKFQLLKGVDPAKDQSYFLHRLNQEQLSAAIFPIGEYKKTEVRELARKFGLLNSEKRDSQGLCFVGHIDLREFLGQRIKDKPGEIVNTSNKKIGEHQGLFWYTRGQRKGIKVGGTGPFYVVEKDLESNRLIVTDNAEDKRLYSDTVEFSDANWLDGEGPFKKSPPLFKGGLGGVQCAAQIRYHGELIACEVSPVGDGRYLAKFKKPQWAVVPGQHIVFYDNDVCLGGGIIEKAS